MSELKARTKPIQTLTYEITVNVHEEPLLDDHDREILPAVISEAVQAVVTDWGGGGFSVTCSRDR